MKLIQIIILHLYSTLLFSQVPEQEDKPNEFGMDKICSYHFLNKKELNKIIVNARNGDSKSAYALYFSQNMFPNNELLPNGAELLQIFLESGNPFAAMISGFEELEKNDYRKGIEWLEIAAEYGIISVINYMHIIYNGDKYKQLKNSDLELYWLRKLALSGNIYNLKKYIYNNPHKLKKHELKNWKEAYSILLKTKGFETIYKNKSIETTWILKQIDKNRQKIQKTLKKNHDWYGDFEFCLK